MTAPRSALLAFDDPDPLFRHLDDVDRYTIREGEFVCNTLVGWNFGDGHLHDERLIAAVQRQLSFEPGELRLMFVESQPIHKKTQSYRVIDAALGVVERGLGGVGRSQPAAVAAKARSR
jgi:hypothetical protein